MPITYIPTRTSYNRLDTLTKDQNFEYFPLSVSLIETVPAQEADATAKHLENLGINVHNTPMRIGLCTDKVIEMNRFRQVTTAVMFEKGSVPHEGGLFSYEIFGSSPQERRKRCGYIDLKRKFFHPYIFEALCEVMQKAKLVSAGKGVWKIEDGDLVQVAEGEEGYDPFATGIRWLVNHFHDLKFTKNDSYTHNEYVDLLESCTDDEIFITKYPVIPVFYRDANFSGHKRDIPDINDMYKKVIQYANALRAPSLAQFSNNTEFMIQTALVTIRRYGQSLVQGKRGFMKQFVIGKTTAYGARSVITEPITSGAQTPSDLMIDLFHSGFPIATCCSMAYPFIEHWIIDFFSREFETRERKQILVRNPDTGEMELKFERVGDVMAFYNPSYIEKKVNQFMETYGNQFEPIKIPMADGSSSYMLFTGRPYSKDPKNPAAPPTARRAMTWTDLLYLACVNTLEFGGKMAYITRYPLEDYFGTFPSMIRVTSTEEHEPMTINGVNYPFYPKVVPGMPQDEVSTKFVETVTMDNMYLKGLGGDYDGDTISEKVCFTEEANDEAFAIMNDAKHFVSISGSITRTIGNEAFLTFYGLTRRE